MHSLLVCASSSSALILAFVWKKKVSEERGGSSDCTQVIYNRSGDFYMERTVWFLLDFFFFSPKSSQGPVGSNRLYWLR